MHNASGCRKNLAVCPQAPQYSMNGNSNFRYILTCELICNAVKFPRNPSLTVGTSAIAEVQINEVLQNGFVKCASCLQTGVKCLAIEVESNENKDGNQQLLNIFKQWARRRASPDTHGIQPRMVSLINSLK